MIKTCVVLVEEHDEISHGKILIQKIDEAEQVEVEDVFGNKHKIERYIVMTEVTMDELVQALKRPEVREVIKRFLPAYFDSIEIQTA